MLRTRIADDLKAAMKSKDSCKVSTLRLILAALKDRDIAARSANNRTEMNDARILDLLNTMVRQRQDSIRLYEQGGRLDLAEQEAQEIAVIESYMPEQLDEGEIDQAVRAVIDEVGACGVKDMGRTMAALKQNYAGRMDFSKASGFVKGYLTSAA
ncbi:MAG: GatB/YqeY domain-containing protein [Alphaproteobacteria bacterium]|jgi:hypothetical protein|nr:GatB/YqeY domain-containing protein [Alphaproteobacteria bacterium]MDP6517819.1 GatB/YqeY domain-containing protein [Alphaproteobacteria bacterium]|tara:strand:- start:177 stop:641 length:465 start_codon:yes stop_codon:yes gene_type:complete